MICESRKASLQELDEAVKWDLKSADKESGRRFDSFDRLLCFLVWDEFLRATGSKEAEKADRGR